MENQHVLLHYGKIRQTPAKNRKTLWTFKLSRMLASLASFGPSQKENCKNLNVEARVKFQICRTESIVKIWESFPTGIESHLLVKSASIQMRTTTVKFSRPKFTGPKTKTAWSLDTLCCPLHRKDP